MYAPLWTKSNYSFLEGASHPEELVTQAAALGLPGLALTDRDGFYGIARAHVRAQELGFPLIVGAQVSVGSSEQLLLLVRDHDGYRQLCRLLTTGRRRSPKGESRVSWAEVCAHAAGLTALCFAPDAATTEELRGAFGQELYVLLARHLQASDVAEEARRRAHAEHHALPTVAATEVLYHEPDRRRLQDVLTCIRHRCTLHDAGRRLRPNAEHALQTPAAFARLWQDDPHSVRRSLDIAAACTFSLSQLRYRYPADDLPDGLSSSAYLRRLTMDGACRRYGDQPPADVMAQIERELDLIAELDYGGYFLTMHEIVHYCRSQDILCQGRGSAANSVVCYCLGITAVDPVRLDLLFERFISRERAEPPDIDLDIEHQRREEVIQHVFESYGRDRAAMVANVIRYRQRSAIRDVGKVLDIPETALDRFAKQADYRESLTLDLMDDVGISRHQRRHLLFMELVQGILEFPRHLSIHPGGFLLGHEPVHDLVPIENGAMEGRTVIQWDKYDVEALGLFKVDLLGLGALSHLRGCFDLMRLHGGPDLCMARVPADDPATYAMLQRADSVGVFQVESRAQMSMLPRLKPERYYDLVVQISIVRPGPIVGGMVHPYLRRRSGEEAIDYPHPSLIPVLQKTLGVPLFQEQVMKLAMIAADYSPGEADQLRRDIGAWKSTGRLARHHDVLVNRMMAKGITEEFAERVFQQISGFGEYGFPESHAASFALIAYCGSWLKCHHPAVFTCGLLNAQPMGFYSAATIVEDARRHGIQVLPVDINHSAWDCTLEPLPPGENGGRAIGISGHDPGGGSPFSNMRPRPNSGHPHSPSPARSEFDAGLAVRMGLRYVKGLGSRQRQRFEAARRDGAFQSEQDFARRTRFDHGSLSQLAEAGAFESLGRHRRESLWSVLADVDDTPLDLELAEDASFEEPSGITCTAWDYAAAGHSAREHILAPLRQAMAARGLPSAAEVNALPHDAPVHFAALAICRQQPSTAGGVTFMTLEDETGFVNVVIWERVLERYRTPIKTLAFLGVTGRIQSQDDVVHIVAKSFWRPPPLRDQPDERPPATNADGLLASRRPPKRGYSARL